MVQFKDDERRSNKVCNFLLRRIKQRLSCKWISMCDKSFMICFPFSGTDIMKQLKRGGEKREKTCSLCVFGLQGPEGPAPLQEQRQQQPWRQIGHHTDARRAAAGRRVDTRR